MLGAKGKLPYIHCYCSGVFYWNLYAAKHLAFFILKRNVGEKLKRTLKRAKNLEKVKKRVLHL